MEVLINQLINSTQSEEIKKMFVKKIFDNLLNKPSTSSEVKQNLQTLTEWVLTSDKDYLKSASLAAYQKLATANLSVFQEFCNTAYIIDLFSNVRYTNRLNMLGLVMTALHCLKETDLQSKAVLFRVIRTQSLVYLRQHGVNMSLAAAMAMLYQSQPDTLPQGGDSSKLSSVIVNLLSNYRITSVPDQVPSFRRDTESLAVVLEKMWTRSGNLSIEATLETLNDVYKLISNSGDQAPSVCLCSVIEKVPPRVMAIAAKTILEQADTESGETKLVTALSRLVEWLCMWKAPNLSSWVLQLMKGVTRHSILIAVTDDCILRLTKTLQLPYFRSQIEEIFFFLFYGYQQPETAFHKIVSLLPKVLDGLLAGGADSKAVFERLAEAARYMTELHPGYPDLYTPVLARIVTSPGISEERRRVLESRSWSALPRLPDGRDGREPPSLPAGGSLADRMNGLMNLGNTCYMNSVLQALYMTARFTDLVLAQPASHQEPIMTSLKNVLAFLRFSRRGIFSPSEFHRIARPPWFEAGRQQDCSEFLKYLLDTLYEEERAVAGPEEQAVLTSSRSTTLNCISELPETRPADGRDDDEDMESQFSDDEDKTEAGGGLADSQASLMEECGAGGGSSGSLSLQRWCTEENLSVGGSSGSREVLNVSMGGSREALLGSREGKQDLLEGMIHDSHSNSTDSGIQSVGDSAHGSQDKLSESDGHLQAEGSEVARQTQTTTSAGNNTHQPPSLVHKIFGGRLETRYECQHCKHCSTHQDWFTDIGLAIPQPQSTPRPSSSSSTTTIPPDPSPAVAPPPSDLVASDNSSPLPTVASSSQTSLVNESDSPVSMDTGSARQSRSTSPLPAAPSPPSGQGAPPPAVLDPMDAQSLSPPEITVTPPGDADDGEVTTSDVNAKVTAAPPLVVTPSNPMASDLSVDDLVDNYLAPERLEGENQYQCDGCNKKQDAVKSTRILSAPAQLLLTLLRFKYDRKTNRRAKVFTNIHYPRELQLPMSGTDGGIVPVKYKLYGVVVHSGYSSDGGHYYTWARQPESDLWHNFNDSVVTMSSWDKFTQQTTNKFTRDTPYLLFYQRQSDSSLPPVQPPSREVMEAVENDNIKYQRAKEGLANNGGQRVVKRRGPDRDDYDDSGGSSGCGDSFSNFGGGHFVC